MPFINLKKVNRSFEKLKKQFKKEIKRLNENEGKELVSYVQVHNWINELRKERRIS